MVRPQGGYSGEKRDGGGGEGWGPTYFFGSKIFNSCIFLGLKNLRVFFWVQISARLMVTIYKHTKKIFPHSMFQNKSTLTMKLRFFFNRKAVCLLFSKLHF